MEDTETPTFYCVASEDLLGFVLPLAGPAVLRFCRFYRCECCDNSKASATPALSIDCPSTSRNVNDT